jgi:CheY-like chemotaxis protein
MGTELSRGRVLVVGDDRVNRMLLTRSLEREGPRVDHRPRLQLKSGHTRSSGCLLQEYRRCGTDANRLLCSGFMRAGARP